MSSTPEPNLLLWSFVPDPAANMFSDPFQLDHSQHLAAHMLPSQAGVANTKDECAEAKRCLLGHPPGSETASG